ncbi:acyltransferase family protein [Agromyces aerolatus]|uniref:acyltransferase family protein n=1 Tax=Agromyces sp. LY-1074 TaxID=3074080 RepID=UPI00286653A3|nr:MULTISPECIES: acyltransferase family protein [unclassified Agromyces]MDR5701831.1 acyltransferase family protein [Agromyces sp. LY-1074]MDR5707499.1 acyltransferase family protein [Agromyces sp. LY-1358]
MQIDPPAPRTRKRVPLWDNARWIAITLVVIGHGILPLIAEDDAAYSVYLSIYSFHVAVFVTVAGYFAKSGPPTARSLRQVLTDIVFPYVIFETIWTVIRFALGGEFDLDYSTASWTLWFLIALAVWRIALPYLVLLRFPLTIAVIISIAAGYTESIDSTLALTRTFGMFPFFVFGWKLRQMQLTGRWLELRPAIVWRWRAGAIAVFAALLVLMPIAIETWRDLRLRRFMLYDESYVAIGYDEPWSGAIRLVLLTLAMLLAVAFLILMPRGRHWFTPFGAATMYIYLLHSFVLYPIRESDVLAGQQPFWVLPVMIVFCIGVSIVLSLKPVRRIFRPLVEPRARWLFRADPATPTGTIVLPADALPPAAPPADPPPRDPSGPDRG